MRELNFMTKKELKKLAKELARLERIVKTTEDNEVRYRAEQEIMTLTNKVEDLEDMVMIDEMVMTLLEQEI
jgi:protein subunit release factor A